MMKWHDRLKAIRHDQPQSEKQTMPGMTTDINCQKVVLAPFGSAQFGHSSKFECDYTPEDLEIILQELIAIMMFDGGLSEAEAVRIASDEVGTSWS